MLYDHVIRLRRTPLFATSLFVVGIESNYAFESDRYASRLITEDGIDHLIFMDEDECRTGVRTTNKLKEQMALLFMEAISYDAVEFYDKLVTSCDDEGDAKNMKRLLFKQLENYSTKPSMSGKRIFTGKINKQQDDLAICLQLNFLYHRMFWHDKTKYGKYHRYTNV